LSLQALSQKWFPREPSILSPPPLDKKLPNPKNIVSLQSLFGGEELILQAKKSAQSLRKFSDPEDSPGSNLTLLPRTEFICILVLLREAPKSNHVFSHILSDCILYRQSFTSTAPIEA
jgi:hypothetical protein